MSYLVYPGQSLHGGPKLLSTLSRVDGLPAAHVALSLDALRRRLSSSRADIGVVLLVAVDEQELRTLASMRDLMLDFKIILIVPDWDEATVALGHTLHPRYLCEANDDYGDVVAVLEKALKDAGGERTGRPLATA